MPKKNGKPYNSELQCVYCDKPVFAKMMCKRHYSASDYRNRAKNGHSARDLDEIAPDVPHGLRGRRSEKVYEPCRVAGCERLSWRGCGLCPMHQGRASSWGLTPDGLVEWLSIGACESCGTTERLCLDHDHSHCQKGCSECIRGVLCNGCNAALGFLRESEASIMGLLAYRRRF